MLYPIIYTRTKYHDYRIVTSTSLAGLPHSVVQMCTEVARTMIDAENDQLKEPSWALVKKNRYTLWGIAILNDVLGDDNKDKYNRPVRGFFGFISDTSVSKLPYSISYFKETYRTYVMPIWDSREQTEQISCQLPTISGYEFITKSTLLNLDINIELGVSRIFPHGSDCKGLIEAVFASFVDCSIATNIHKKSQCIEFGKDKLSFMNVVMSPSSNVMSKKDIKVYVKETPSSTETFVNPDKEDPKPFEDSTCPKCGKPTVADDTLCPECMGKEQNKRYLKYGLYGFFTVVCLLLILKGPSIWESILSPKHTHEIVNYEDKSETSEWRHGYNADPFLNTRKSIFNIQDANLDHIFGIQYHSSSNIKMVEPSEEWIRIITPKEKYSQSGVITFVCEPISKGVRDGEIKLVNEEGKDISIKVHQTVTNQTSGSISVTDKENQNEQ